MFGCPGGKAQIRRKNLGEVAGKNSNMVYITADDPGVEEVSKISSEIEKYLKEYTNNYEKIDDICDELTALMGGNLSSTPVFYRDNMIIVRRTFLKSLFLPLYFTKEKML